ncbi:MAG TPA: KEOPS complex subunit Pcc1 [archaeon]|nr:KEOPS complex subunit Pcc1 [archaeon]
MPEVIKEFVFPSEAKAIAVARAILPELNKSYQKRSKTLIKTNKNVVLLKIVAEDEHSLRASLTSFKGLLELGKNVSEI